MESEYDIVDDQEEVLNVRILPARPMHEEMEYAGRGRENITHTRDSLAHIVCISFQRV